MNEIRMPRLPRGWAWIVDRTSDVIFVTIESAEQVVHSDCLAVTRSIMVRLWFFRLHAFWMFVVGNRITGLRSRVRNALFNWREDRREARSNENQALAAALDGTFDNTGQRVLILTITPDIAGFERSLQTTR